LESRLDIFVMRNQLELCYFICGGAGERSYAAHGGRMMALVLEVYGAFCLFSLIAFLVWAWVAKLRPDLDELEFDLDELEKLKKPASREQSDFDPQVGGPDAQRPPRGGAAPPAQTQTSPSVPKPSAADANPEASANIEPRTHRDDRAM
jgi:hypothetical protein